MNAAQRRERILTRLTGASEPMSASLLAGELGVSRQIVVGDVALLRAAGAQIDATPRLYGELRGNLNLASRYDVDLFLRQAADTPECLLSRMTGGVHLHTLHCPDEASFRRVKAALAEKGLLYQKE